MIEEPPKISVGVPVYNGAPYIRDALEALARQTYPNFEVLISDNCSTDETADICRSYVEADQRFKYVRQTENIGLTANFEYVLHNTDGDYFCWRAHDDLSDETFLATLGAALQSHPEAWLAVTSSKWIDAVENYEKLYTPKDTKNAGTYRRIRQQLLDAVPLWFYHLYRREELIRQWAFLRDEIGLNTMHSDVLFLTQLVTAGRIVSAPGSTLYSRRLQAKAYPYSDAPLSAFEECIGLYNRIVRKELATHGLPLWQKAVLRTLALRYLDRRVVRLKPYFKRKWKQRMSGVGQASKPPP